MAWPNHSKIQRPLRRDLRDSACEIECVLETLDLILMVYDSLRAGEGRIEGQLVLNRVHTSAHFISSPTKKTRTWTLFLETTMIFIFIL